jgi:hypothetical protein
MRVSAACSAVLFLGCTGASGLAPQQPTPVWIRSHNRSPVDVYLLCSDRNARWLGTVSARTADALEIPADQRYCIRGMNFFLVVQESGRGYWVGPIRPAQTGRVELVIEKYAGLSSARLQRDR